MNAVIVVSTCFAIALAQKPGYLAGTLGQSELAYRFRQNATTISPLGNRLGLDGSATTSKIPVDARGDHELVDRLLTWPKENRPYWLVNAEAIERFRNQQNQGVNTVQQQGQQGQLGQQGQVGQRRQNTNLQSRFGGSASNQNTQPGFNPNVQYDDFGNPVYWRK